MRTNRLPLLLLQGLLLLPVFTCTFLAQAPPAIQFFMPGGGLPGRELRFTLTLPDGRIEILFTDTKGKFPLTGGLVRDGDYTLQIESDRRTFETTVQRFKLVRGTISYLPIFLQPLRSEVSPRAVVDVAAYDAKVPPEARAAHEAAMQAVSAGNAEIAISEFTRALALYPQHLRALNDLGVLYLKLNRLDEAAAAFTQAVSLNARFHLPRLNLGLVRNRQGNYGAAVKVLNALVKDEPSLGQARILLAEGLIVSKQWDEAEQQLRTGLKDESLERSARAEALVKLGRVLSSQERYGAAAVEIEKAAALEPESASVQLYLGAAYAQLNKLVEAEPALQKAYTLGGKRVATAQLLLGQLYYNQQKFEPALRAFEQFISDMPTASNVSQIKEVVEKIKVMLKK